CLSAFSNSSRYFENSVLGMIVMNLTYKLASLVTHTFLLRKFAFLLSQIDKNN
ncbi:hypothetical protein AVDCRST_MAG92-4585, partial [uncultured Coleofasciculus sp.]